MKLLLLAQFFPPDIGGEERHVLNLANELSGRGHDVHVGTLLLDGMAPRETLESGVQVHRFRSSAMRIPAVYSQPRPHHPPLPDPDVVRALNVIVQRERPDVVHAHNWIVNSALAVRRPSDHRFGLMLTLHDYSQVCATKRLMRDALPCSGPGPVRCLPCATKHYGGLVGPVTTLATAAMRPWKSHGLQHVVSVSRAVARANGVEEGPGRSVIPNFVPDTLLEATPAVPPGDNPEDAPIVFIGDLSREKGVPVLLEAYARLAAPRPPLLLAGRRTPDAPSVLPAGATMHVDWPHEEVMAAFRRALLVVLPSTWPDPCPTTVLEAMASGRATVTTRLGGMVDMVDDGVSGRLVEPGDVHALTDVLRELISDPQQRARLGAGARAAVQAFTASSVVDRLEAVYRTLAPGQAAEPGMPSATSRLVVDRKVLP